MKSINSTMLSKLKTNMPREKGEVEVILTNLSKNPNQKYNEAALSSQLYQGKASQIIWSVDVLCNNISK